jgi:hypothetical protein
LLATLTVRGIFSKRSKKPIIAENCSKSFSTRKQQRISSSEEEHAAEAGYVTYSVRIQCRTGVAASNWSGWVSDQVQIVTPPAPSSPGGLGTKGSWGRMCDNSAFWGTGQWNATSRATSYNVQIKWTDTSGFPSAWSSAGSTTATEKDVYRSVSFDPNYGIRYQVQAVGPGGSSGWAEANMLMPNTCVA